MPTAFRTGRTLIILGFLAAALAGLAAGLVLAPAATRTPEGRYAVLSRSLGARKVEVARYSLDRPGAFPVSAPWGQLVVEVRDGKARIALANPPCDPETHKVYNPWISRPGELDVCLPHRVILEVRS